LGVSTAKIIPARSSHGNSFNPRSLLSISPKLLASATASNLPS
jgi:hypothetical protein